MAFRRRLEAFKNNIEKNPEISTMNNISESQKIGDKMGTINKFFKIFLNCPI